MTDDVDIEREADRLLSWSKDLLAQSVRQVKMPSPVSVQRSSSNRKLAPQRSETARSGRMRNVPIGPFVSSTYVSIDATCPSTCRWKDNGCYAQTGFTRSHMDRRALGSKRMAALDVTKLEVQEIDSLWARGVPQDGARGGRDLRLHVAGDVSCEKGATLLAGAAQRWTSRGGGSVWTYTHRWQDIDRLAWGPVSVFASVEDPKDLWPALHRGYAPAFVVDEFPHGGRAFDIDGVRLVPCPAEAGVRTCAECRLCLDQDLASRNTGIAFAFHGGHRVDDGKTRLRILQQHMDPRQT